MRNSVLAQWRGPRVLTRSFNCSNACRRHSLPLTKVGVTTETLIPPKSRKSENSRNEPCGKGGGELRDPVGHVRRPATPEHQGRLHRAPAQSLDKALDTLNRAFSILARTDVASASRTRAAATARLSRLTTSSDSSISPAETDAASRRRCVFSDGAW